MALRLSEGLGVTRLPTDKFVRTAKGRREALVVREVVNDRKHGVLTLNMKLRLEKSMWQEIRVDAAKLDAGNLRVHIGSTGFATHPWGCLYHHLGEVLAKHFHRGSRID